MFRKREYILFNKIKNVVNIWVKKEVIVVIRKSFELNDKDNIIN